MVKAIIALANNEVVGDIPGEGGRGSSEIKYCSRFSKFRDAIAKFGQVLVN